MKTGKFTSILRRHHFHCLAEVLHHDVDIWGVKPVRKQTIATLRAVAAVEITISTLKFDQTSR
jgi:hypothetical protein